MLKQTRSRYIRAGALQQPEIGVMIMMFFCSHAVALNTVVVHNNIIQITDLQVRNYTAI